MLSNVISLLLQVVASWALAAGCCDAFGDVPWEYTAFSRGSGIVCLCEGLRLIMRLLGLPGMLHC